MNEYIERQALLDAIPTTVEDKQISLYGAIADFIIKVNTISAADVAPVVHSKWEICCDGYYPYCLNCKSEPPGREMTKFCPNCGAKMDGGGKNVR